ncbi:PD-(D/E)XK nuclease family protein, partial [bacterium]|nr:PD-(D/E)XK nuclease family protein [bacterium]
LLRTAYRSMWTAAELLEHLGQLVEQEQAYDGIPARHRRTPVVRLMNLHKVKGLEAPVVFLADPSGESEHAVQLHIDRSGDTARGYLAVFGERRGKGAPPLLAHPPGWDALAEAEGEFEGAEKTRLLYVAATRARDQLVVSQRANSNKSNPWGFFAGHLDGPPLGDPGEQAPPKGEVVTLTTHDVQEARARIRTRWAETSRPTCAVGAAKQLSVEKVPFRPGAGEHGVEWGELIHRLLQAAMQGATSNLAALARSEIGEEGRLDADAAVATVRAVMASEVWARAAAAGQTLAEVPFAVALRPDDPILEHTAASASVPTLLRGVLDLVFREDDGWVVVDYKTDRVSAARPLDGLVAHYLPQVRTYAEVWARLTDEPVKEMGLYFTHSNTYRAAR